MRPTRQFVKHALLIAASFLSACAQPAPEAPPATPAMAAAPAQPPAERGRYLVTVAVCDEIGRAHV